MSQLNISRFLNKKIVQCLQKINSTVSKREFRKIIKLLCHSPVSKPKNIMSILKKLFSQSILYQV